MMGTESDKAGLAVEHSGGYYAEPQRVQCLNFLLHLAPYSDGSLLVSGEKGSGKSTLLQQFITKGGDSWRVCLLDALQLEALPVFFREIQQDFGFSLQGANDHAGKVQVFIEHLATLQKRGIRPIIIIDEAQMLLEEVAEFLELLLAALQGKDSRLSLIFVAETSLSSRAWFDAIKHFGLHSFALTPLDFDESMRYMKHCLQQHGFEEGSVSASKMKKIYKQAQGNLGRINNLILAEIVPQKAAAPVLQTNDFEVQLKMTTEEMSQPKKPIKFSRILLGILTLALVLALYFEDEMNAYFEPGQKHPEAIEVVTTDMQIATPPEMDLLDDAQPMHALDSEVDAMSEGEDLTAGDGDVMLAEDNSTMQMDVAEAGLAAADMQSESMTAKPEAEVVVAASTPAVLAPAPEPVAEAPQPVVQQIPPAITTPQAVPVEKEVVSDEGVIRRESWILAQNPEHYTLQIMSFSHEMGIAKTLEDVPAKEKFSYFKYRKDGKIWYRLAYGIYPDRKSAQAAMAKGLPKELGKVDPWVRRLSDVQKEITSQ